MCVYIRRKADSNRTNNEWMNGWMDVILLTSTHLFEPCNNNKQYIYQKGTILRKAKKGRKHKEMKRKQ